MAIDQSHRALVAERIMASIGVKQQLLAQSELLATVASLLIAAYRRGNKVLLFGNGGSAADAQHIAGELVGRFYLERRALPALALTVDSSILTAIGNDYGYEQVFARQVAALGQTGDVAIGISTSGNAPSVLAGLQAAKEHGLITIGLTGSDGGQLKHAADYCVCVPSRDTPRIQECHILVAHIWCELVEQALFQAS
jgi:D-sedoheptulose 7-phosphate isomerase